MTVFLFQLFTSFVIVAFGQPAWVSEAGLLAAAGGYALFWKAMLQWTHSKFFLAAFWFIATQAVQLSWMTSMDYMGPWILVVYTILLLGLGTQFGFLSSFLNSKKNLSHFECFALAGAWVLLEWTRLFLFTGFPWNPSGLTLAGNRYSIQLASTIGIYGLSFWVFWTNLEGLTFLLKPSIKKGIAWAFFAFFPYGFGLSHESWVKSSCTTTGKRVIVAVINTKLKIEENHRDYKNPNAFISPLVQWERVWSYLKKEKPVQLIVLPEAAFPYGADFPFCPLALCEERWQNHFGEKSLQDFPPLRPPFAFPFGETDHSHWMITNAFFAQALANHFQADVIVGLDHDGKTKWTNAAFLFRAEHQMPERYDKQILVPVGEYIPFAHVKWIADFLAYKFGIHNSFDAGKEAKILQSFVPLGVPICLEEIYSELVRDFRKRGAKFLVSLSNDAWFPTSRLAQQHFDHARIRAVENGVYLIRSSNMGWTGGVDCFGQPIRLLSPEMEGAIYLSLPLFTYSTLFSFLGNLPIFWLSGLSFLLFLFQVAKKKLLLNGELS